MAKDTKTDVDPAGPTEVDLPPTTTSTRGPPQRTALGRFRLDAALGSGGMGDVYRAYDPVLERSVALKVLRTRGQGDEEAQRRRMLREARAAAALAHPNTVTIFEVGEADGEVFLAMELLEGRGLRELIAHGDAPLSSKLKWLLEAARALAAAHARGLVHRDVKPDNMFVCRDGTLKLLDFGIAKREGDEVGQERDALGPSSLRTAGGVRAGTPRYMAPEQRAGAPTDARTDEYAWGLVAFELLSGVHVLGGLETAAGGEAEGGGSASPVTAALRQRAPDLPQGVVAAIERALEPQKTARFPTMEPIVQAFEAVVAVPSAPANAIETGPQLALPPPTDVSTGATTLPTPRRRNPRAIAAVAASLAVAVALGIVALRPRPPAAPPSVPAACRADATRAVPFHVHDLAAVLPGGALVVARDAIGENVKPSLLENDAHGTMTPFSPLGDADYADLHLEGISLGDKPALVMGVHQGTAGALLAVWRPDFPLLNGVTALQRLTTPIIDLATYGLGEESVLVVHMDLGGHNAYTVQTMILAATPTHNVIDDVRADAPAITGTKDRLAVAYRSEGMIRVVFLNRQGARVGDTLTAAMVASRPSVVFAGDTLVVLWIEVGRGTTRLRSASLPLGATAFTPPRDAVADAVADIHPAATRTRAGKAEVAWVAARGGRQVVRVSPLDGSGALTGPTDIGATGEVRGVGVAPGEQGIDVAWTDATTETVHVSRVSCN